MSALSNVATQAVELPVSERLALAKILIDASDVNDTFDASAEELWEKEIASRLASVKAGTATSRPAEDVFVDIEKKLA